MVVVVLRASAGRHNVILARNGVCSFVFSSDVLVRILMMCFFSSSIALFVLCESWCIRVFDRLSRVRRLRSMARLRSVRTSLLNVLGLNLGRLFPRELGEWCFSWEEVGCYAKFFF